MHGNLPAPNVPVHTDSDARRPCSGQFPAPLEIYAIVLVPLAFGFVGCGFLFPAPVAMAGLAHGNAAFRVVGHIVWIETGHIEIDAVPQGHVAFACQAISGISGLTEAAGSLKRCPARLL